MNCPYCEKPDAYYEFTPGYEIVSCSSCGYFNVKYPDGSSEKSQNKGVQAVIDAMNEVRKRWPGSPENQLLSSRSGALNRAQAELQHYSAHHSKQDAERSKGDAARSALRQYSTTGKWASKDQTTDIGDILGGKRGRT